MDKLKYYMSENLLIKQLPYIIVIAERGSGKKYFKEQIEKLHRESDTSRGKCDE